MRHWQQMTRIFLCALLLLFGGCLDPGAQQRSPTEAARTKIAGRVISFRSESSNSVSYHECLWLQEVEEFGEKGTAYLLVVDNSMNVRCVVELAPIDEEHLSKTLAADGEFLRDMLQVMDERGGVPLHHLTNRNFSCTSLVTEQQSIDDTFRQKGINDESARKIWALRQAHVSKYTKRSYFENLIQWIEKGDSAAWVEYLLGPAQWSGKIGNWLGWSYDHVTERVEVFMDEKEHVVSVQYYFVRID